MWLSSSSVGRKFLMALTGACLVLFVTFHCLMNAIAICWPTAYNSVCEFLGANWYALVASAGLAVLFILHIIYAFILTMQNRKARGPHRYAISKRPKNVEWSSQNMLVLGIVILAFLIVHLIQFWAKMQLAEISGAETAIPPTAGTLFIQEAFSLIWTPIVYIIGFIALWFHLNHGFWSMFQSVGWDNTDWIPRLKKIANWWVSIVIVLFIAQAVVFTVKANQDYYKTNPELRAQYISMIGPMVEHDFGPDADQITSQIANMPFDQLSTVLNQQVMQMEMQLQQLDTPEGQNMIKSQPGAAEQVEQMRKAFNGFKRLNNFVKYLQPEVEVTIPEMPAMQPQAAPAQVEAQPAPAEAEQPANETSDNNSNN